MRTLILEDDELIAELLATVILGLYPGTAVETVSRVAEGLAAWKAGAFDLVLADWNLPDGSGLALVKAVRTTSDATPVVVISARSDRDSIRAAASLKINGYISKPFSVELVRERLKGLVDPGLSDVAGPPSLFRRLREAADSPMQLTGGIDAGAILALVQRQEDLTPSQLSERWKQEPAISAKLLGVANLASLRRLGQPVENVKDAITAIGVPMALNQALAVSMDVAGQLADERLKALAVKYQDQTEGVALQAQRLANSFGDAGERHYTAALLSRTGELVTLRLLQQHLQAGGELETEELEVLLAEWAQTFGNRIKIQWRLSLEIRELVGSIYLLPKGTVARDRLIMRAAGLIAGGDGEGEECLRLLRRLGLTEEQGMQTNGSS